VDEPLVLRTLLFVPAHRARMVEKAPTAGADAVVLDLEDAVPPADKAAARAAVNAAVASIATAGVSVFVRVNGIATGMTRDDVFAAVAPGLRGIVLAKTESPQDVRDLDVLLREAEMAAGIRPGDVATLPLIETPRGLLRVEDIARASDRVLGLSLGAEDYCAALGVERNVEGTAIAHLRYQVVTVASALGKVAIDTPYGDVADLEGLVAETKFARAIGCAGKYVVHPEQVAPVNEIFTPAEGEVAQARAMLDAYDAALRRGEGAVSVEGRMVDEPVAVRARRLIARADAIARKVASP
jgi:citrate lyase subunit beta/citryl-CoA lyase